MTQPPVPRAAAPEQPATPVIEPAAGRRRPGWVIPVVSLVAVFLVSTLVLANWPARTPTGDGTGGLTYPPDPTYIATAESLPPPFKTEELAAFAAPWLRLDPQPPCRAPQQGGDFAEIVICDLPGLRDGTAMQLIFIAGGPEGIACSDEFAPNDLPTSPGLRVDVVPRPDKRPGSYCESTIAGSAAPNGRDRVNALQITWTGDSAGYPVSADLIYMFPTTDTAIFKAEQWPAFRKFWLNSLKS
jgi:hypothetical protein